MINGDVRHALSPIAIFLVLSFLTSCWEGISRRVLATILSVHGEVVYGSTKGNDFRPVNLDTTLGGSDVVRTSEQGSVDLLLLPGVLLRLSENSELKIHDLSVLKDGNETDAGMRNRKGRIELNRGKLIVYFEESDEAAARQLTVVTDQVTINANAGCLFQVTSDKARTRVTSASGHLYVPEGRNMSVIEAGFFQQWPKENSAPIAAANDQAGQTAISEALKAREELQKLRDQDLPRRNRFPH